MSRPDESPTHSSPSKLSPAIERNIDALVERRREHERNASAQDRMAAAIGDFAGSMLFVYIHLVVFGVWIAVNTGLLSFLPPWDPSLVILAMVASVEAIFLSTFVLINQNRMAASDAARAELDLQISLLNEHETTKLVAMVDAIAKRLNVDERAQGDIDELKRDVSPEAVLDKLEKSGTS